MAIKGQKFNKYSNDLKEKVLEEYYQGISSYYLAKKYSLPHGTISSWGIY